MSQAEIWSTAITVVAAVVIVVLERRFPYDKGQSLFRRGIWTDVVWFSIVFNYIMGWVIFGWVIPGIDNLSNVSRLHLVSAWPIWVQCLFFFLVHDLYIYCFHRLMHRSKFLWRLHECHHSCNEVDWAAGSRTHAVETLINQTVEYAPIILLGAAPEVALFKGVLDALWGMYIHSNINVRTGWLQYVINGPEMHRWHHAREKHDINFATKIATWDWLFGTAYMPNAKPKSYGIDVEFPTNIVTQQLFAFRPFRAEGEGTGPSAVGDAVEVSVPAVAGGSCAPQDGEPDLSGGA